MAPKNKELRTFKAIWETIKTTTIHNKAQKVEGKAGGVITWNSSPFMVGSKETLCQVDIPRNILNSDGNHRK